MWEHSYNVLKLRIQRHLISNVEVIDVHLYKFYSFVGNYNNLTKVQYHTAGGVISW